MKTKLCLFCIMLCNLITVRAIPYKRFISEREAQKCVEKYFEGKDVDYFIHEDNNQSYWTFFVDAEPMKGWKHDCYVLTIPKQVESNAVVCPSIEKRSTPPQGNYIPLKVRKRYDVYANTKPFVKKSEAYYKPSDSAQRTYAVILSGGIDKVCNYESYWNDCSFIYQTLVNKYGIPKENIYPIISDGDNPEVDMLVNEGEYRSQPLDLDFDGIQDISLAATKENVQSTFSILANKLEKDDHLFFFVIDHGGSVDNEMYSTICLWDYEEIFDYELESLLTPFEEKFVNVNIVLGQCFSGGFVDNLKKRGFVVATASSGSESSWPCPDKPFNEFVYWWTCAVNGATHDGSPVDADIDNNGRITMEEAFSFAEQHDREEETPQFSSIPRSIGEDLSFDYIPSSVDLYIKDNDEDTGKEPNMTTDEFWKSPSIWVRNQDDGICEHQNPVYSQDHQQSVIYVRVHNRGKAKFNGEGKWVVVYWAQASTGINAKTWKGREVYDGGFPTGGILEASTIDSIMPGDSCTVKVIWPLPRLMSDYPEGNFHFCLYARIMDIPYDDGYIEGMSYFNKQAKNDEAQKNITIIRKNDVSKAFNVYVRNILPKSKAYSLELVPQTASDEAIFSVADVEMSMNPKISNAWERGGLKRQNIEIISQNANNPSDIKRVRLLSPKNKLESVNLNKEEFDVISLQFKFKNYMIADRIYSLDLIQKDEEGNIVDGETFIVDPPRLLPYRPIEIGDNPIGEGKHELIVDTIGYTSIGWKDKNGEAIGYSNTVTVLPKKDNNQYTVIATTADGDVATGDITIEEILGIKNITKDNSSNNILVELTDRAPQNAVLSVVSAQNSSNRISENVSQGVSQLTIDTSRLQSGVYIVIYCINGEIIDQRKIVL